MADPYYQDDWVTIYHGDCLNILPTLPDNSVDAVVTDPPYGLEFMGKDWDAPWKSSDNSVHAEARIRRADEVTPKGQAHSTSAGPYLAAAVNKYAAGLPFQQWCQLWATECLRILKPGGYLLSMGGSRTYHRMVCGVEDAGFEIRDTITWHFGSGFPKSLSIGKAIDRKFCPKHIDSLEHICPHSPEGDPWRGHGTALKPATEFIVVARKPLTGTVAANVLQHGTGALNIDATRIGETVETWPATRSFRSGISSGYTEGVEKGPTQATGNAPAGRWPANVALDHTQAAELDKQSGELTSGGPIAADPTNSTIGAVGLNLRGPNNYVNDSGGASRFMYTAKADSGERISYTKPDGTVISHATVKPLALMRWLTRLVTPPGGLVLDPFAGSGTTSEAALLEGFRCVTIEQDADYLPLITQRIHRRRDPITYLQTAGEDLGLFE